MIEFLYKYMPLRPEFFVEPMLRATPVFALNDPFEGVFNENQVKNAMQHQKNFYKNAGINNVQELDESEIENVMGVQQSELFDLGVISFTEDHINPLMWAHYADEHKGMVVQFKTRVPLFSDSSQYILGLGNTRFGKDCFGEVYEFPERVVYRRETPSFEHAEDAEPNSLDEFHWKKFNRNILFTKANDWIYEKESRSVVRLRDADRITCEDNPQIRDICLKHPEIKLIELKNDPDKITSIQITYPNGYERNEVMGDESIKDEIYRLSLCSKNPPKCFFRIDPKCIRGVYFGYKAAYSSCLKNIHDNEHLNHLSKFEMKIKTETYSLFASKI
jgi:hypothetical protein